MCPTLSQVPSYRQFQTHLKFRSFSKVFSKGYAKQQGFSNKGRTKQRQFLAKRKKTSTSFPTSMRTQEVLFHLISIEILLNREKKYVFSLSSSEKAEVFLRVSSRCEPQSLFLLNNRRVLNTIRHLLLIFSDKRPSDNQLHCFFFWQENFG